MLPTSEVNLQQSETQKPAPTAKAELSKANLDRSICGWLGGQSQLPALCAGASSCIRDTEHKYVGCCETIGSCTAGFYTSCVDEGSDGWSPPSSIQTNGIYTCAKNEECYRNTYAENYYQFGCGKSSWATRVETTFTGQPPDITLQLVYTAVTFPGATTDRPTATSSEPPMILMSTNSMSSPSSNPQNTEKVDPGAVAGIVIGVVNVFVILSGLILCIFLRKRRQIRRRNEQPLNSPTNDSNVRSVNPMHRLSAVSHIPKILPTPLRINPSLASYRSPHIAKPSSHNSPTSSRFSSQKVPLVSSNPERDRFIGSISESNDNHSTVPLNSDWHSKVGVGTSLNSRNFKSPNFQTSSPIYRNTEIEDDDTLEYHSVSGNLTESPRSRESRPDHDVTSSVSLMSDQEEMLATASIRHMTHIRRGGNGGYHLVDQVVNDEDTPESRNQSSHPNQI
ncbi:hypothetical protein HI914_03806 [Erysiphe necator]|uniref:Uncharacterized protein n=1 Tax=Uncinula necator TaxID=52586 RepID=A0A0B1P048_UNCNE|nr:hypothetical protein HI914_03806 [Erysiphe necator]KHJ30199.1 hypothetical protein EV44_g1546 [Erysiphe necator]